MPRATLFVFCGKMASGKTTLARTLSQERSAVLISEDVLLGRLYPEEISDVPSYVQYSARLKSTMKPLLVDLLRSGVSIVLDFPANTIKQREWMMDIIRESDALHECHYLDSSDALCKAQLSGRALQEPDRQATDTVEMFEAITRYFEAPGSDEGFELVVHRRS